MSPRTIAFASFSVIRLPVLLAETAPVKSFPASRVIAAAPAVKLDVPATVTTPSSVIAVPTVVTSRLPPIVDACRSTLFAPLLTSASPLTVRARLPSPPSSSVPRLTLPAAVVNAASPPPTVTLPLSRISPLVAVTARSPPIPDNARLTVVAFTIVASPVPAVESVIGPATLSVSRSIA